jgi:CxxC motif-containing protein
MDNLTTLQNTLYILNKTPTFTLSIEIDGEIKSVSGNNIVVFDEITNYFLEKYKIDFSISPVNTLLELCNKNKKNPPIFTSKFIDKEFITSCSLDELEVTAKHLRKKESKNIASIKMIKLLKDMENISLDGK